MCRVMDEHVDIVELFRVGMQLAYDRCVRSSSIPARVERACMVGAMRMDVNEITGFLDKKVTPSLLYQKKFSTEFPSCIQLTERDHEMLTLESYVVMLPGECLGSGTSGVVVQYTYKHVPESCRSLVEPDAPKYALKLYRLSDMLVDHVKQETAKRRFLKRSKEACVFMRELYKKHLAAVATGADPYFPFLPAVFVPGYGILSYSGEQSITQWYKTETGTSDAPIQIVRAMLTALQLLESEGKVLPDGKMGNVVTLTSDNIVTAYVVDWEDVVDGWSTKQVQMGSTYTPPGAICIRNKADPQTDGTLHTGTFWQENAFGYMSAYLMIGCVFTTAVTLWDPDVGYWLLANGVERRQREKSKQSDVEHMDMYNERRDEYLKETASRNDGGILSKFATCLLDFKNTTIKCIADGKESRPFYRDCIKAMLVICKEAACIELEPQTRRNKTTRRNKPTSHPSRKRQKIPTPDNTDTTQILTRS